MKFLARENESGKIGTFEDTISLPRAQPDVLQISSLLLSSQVEAVQKTAQIKTKALAADANMQYSPLFLNGERIIPSVTRVFTVQQTLYVFFQAYLPQKADAESIRAGLVFFRNGQRLSDTPIVSPTEYDDKSHTATFRISLPARWTERRTLYGASGSWSMRERPISAFARNYFALRTATKARCRPDGSFPNTELALIRGRQKREEHFDTSPIGN